MVALVEVADTGERVVLTAPRGNMALSAMRVVVGWMASCVDLQLDRLDDVQLALEMVMAEDSRVGGDLTLTLWAENEGLIMLLDGLERSALREILAAGSPFQPSSDCLLDVRLFLDALVDSYELVDSDGHVFAVRMQKRIA